MKVNVNKIKVVITGESRKRVHNTGRWPCGVCGNPIQCTKSRKWVHRKCSHIKIRVIKDSCKNILTCIPRELHT